MCGYYASYLAQSEIAALLQTQAEVPNLAPNRNVAPMQAALVIRWQPETGDRRLDMRRWGLMPHFTGS
jgi:putative SOS response-associated peptidase YedK